jgi:hypothetical protein
MTAPELTTHLESYLALRTALGLRLQQEQRLLQSFLDFVQRRGATPPLRAAVAVEWACAPSLQGPRADAARRLSTVRRFLSYVHAHAPDTEVPDHHLVAGARRRALSTYSHRYGHWVER